jgi:hypothetical protein
MNSQSNKNIIQHRKDMHMLKKVFKVKKNQNQFPAIDFMFNENKSSSQLTVIFTD